MKVAIRRKSKTLWIIIVHGFSEVKQLLESIVLYTELILAHGICLFSHSIREHLLFAGAAISQKIKL